MNAAQRLIVVRGLGGERAHLAGLLAAALPGPVAHIQGDDLARRWIVARLPDTRSEEATTYQVLRLVVVSYLKAGYSVVVDAPFVTLVAGVWELRTQEMQDLTRLARTFRGITTGIVTLQPVADAPKPLADALAADAIDGEVRVVPDLTGDAGQTVREVLRHLGMA